MKRRQFLATAASAIPATAISNFAFSRDTRQKRLGVALVGLGYYSTDLLAPALQLTQHCYLAGIVTGTPAKATSWQKRFNLKDKNIYNYSNFHSIASNDDIDVVYVVLPPSMHAEYAIRAAGAGKHVWCEKPMAVTVAECEQMIASAKSNKVKLSIGYRMQHEPNTQQIIQFGKDKKFGSIKSLIARAGYFDGRSDHWKQKKSMGGGAMYDMGVYPLNAARYSTGLEPIAVTAKQSTTRPDIYTEVDETMEFDLEFPHGVIASCKTSFGEGLNTLKITCEKGWYALEPFQAYSGIRGETSSGMKLNQTIRNQQAQQMDDDALAIMNDTKVIAPGEEGLKDIRVVEAVYKSVKNKSRVQI